MTTARQEARQEAEQEMAYAIGKEIAAELLDAYARELAQQIRSLRVLLSESPAYGDGKKAGLSSAADLIDPEVNQ